MQTGIEGHSGALRAVVASEPVMTTVGAVKEIALTVRITARLVADNLSEELTIKAAFRSGALMVEIIQ